MSLNEFIPNLSSFNEGCAPTVVYKKKSKRPSNKFGEGDEKQIARTENRYLKYKEKHVGEINTVMSILFKILTLAPDGYMVSMIPHCLKIDMDTLKKTYKFCVGIESQIDSRGYLKEHRWVPFMISKLNPNDSKDPFLVRAIQERISEMSGGEIMTPILLQSGEVIK